MANFITKNLLQTVVFWGTPSADGYGGFTYADPVELNARWEDRQELFINAQGREELSRAIVYVDADVEAGGYLYLGELDDFDSSAPVPTENASAYMIKAFQKIPNLRATDYQRKVWL